MSEYEALHMDEFPSFFLAPPARILLIAIFFQLLHRGEPPFMLPRTTWRVFLS